MMQQLFPPLFQGEQFSCDNFLELSGPNYTKRFRTHIGQSIRKGTVKCRGAIFNQNLGPNLVSGSAQRASILVSGKKENHCSKL